MKGLANLAIGLAIAGLLILGAMLATSARGPAPLPAPTVDETPAPGMHQEKVVFAGGCFWGIQAVFEHVKGVTIATAGYSGGHTANPTYQDVGSGSTGHAESVEVVYDPSQVTFGQLLQVFFSVAHDPTELNYQGPDEGPQYRSAVFFENADQQRIARAYVDQLAQAGAFRKPIVTQIQPFTAFYRAEAYHQDYALHNPMQPYIMINDAPKVTNLKRVFPNLYVDYPQKKKS